MTQNDKHRLRRLRTNARHYAAWRWSGGAERGDKVERINRALTEDELREIVQASDGGFQTFILRYGFY
jgi:hypothetical protein